MCCYVNNETVSIQYNEVLLLHRILVLHIHTKTETLHFYSDLILMNLNRQVYMSVFELF